MYKILSVWTTGNPWEFTVPDGEDKGKVIRLTSYFLDVEKDGTQTKVMINQKPDSDPPKEGEEIDLVVSDKMNKKQTHYKAKKKQKFPPLKCPSCGHEAMLEEFKQPSVSDGSGASKNSNANNSAQEGQTQALGALESTRGASQSDTEPPVENYDDIPFK